jgi:hypothetical protein
MRRFTKKTTAREIMKKKDKVIDHLKGDIKGYEKEQKYFKREEKEDKKLIKELKREKDGKRKK